MSAGLQSYAPGIPHNYEQPHAGVPFHQGSTHHVPLRLWVACVLLVVVGGTFGAYMAGVFN
jgi:hypothetical protein